MKFRSRTIVILEMDENELEVVMNSVDAVATAHSNASGVTVRQATKFMEDYKEAVREFHGKDDII